MGDEKGLVGLVIDSGLIGGEMGVQSSEQKDMLWISYGCECLDEHSLMFPHGGWCQQLTEHWTELIEAWDDVGCRAWKVVCDRACLTSKPVIAAMLAFLQLAMWKMDISKELQCGIWNVYSAVCIVIVVHSA